jgi:RNA 3'-terminal phosphate cyclase (ATP)
METIFIDGSTGEGGGQILRTSLALACITGKALHIENIRAARRNPGLAKQHLSCVQAASQICNGNCEGAALNSRTLDFQPGPVRSGNYYFDIGSAGSATLVIQTILPALFLTDGPSTITVTGGTHNPLAPPFDFLCETFLPAIATAGFYGNCKLIKHGFYPAGGGKITFEIQPWQKQPDKMIDLCKWFDKLTSHPAEQFEIHARIYIAKLPEHIAQRQEKLLLQSNLDIKNVEHIEVTDSDGPGNCVMIRLIGTGRTTVFTAFGMKGKPSQQVVSEVVKMAKDFLSGGVAVDHFLADQLLIYMALSQVGYHVGSSGIRHAVCQYPTVAGCFTTNQLSAHLLTNMEVIKKFLAVDFTTEREKQSYKVCCRCFMENI